VAHWFQTLQSLTRRK